MNAKTIYIFLGSSIVEFKNEREELSNFIHEISGSYFEEQYNVRIKPLTCNHSDQSMSIGGKQKAINEALKECDYCFFIFGAKAGEKTVEEIKIAYDAFKEYQVKPRIYIFFREIEEGVLDQSIIDCKKLIDEEYKHYYQTFKDTDTIKLQIILALNSNNTTTNFNIAIQEGELLLDNKKVTGLDISKTNAFAFDKDLLGIKEEIKKTDTEYYHLRELMKENDSDIYDEQYANVLDRRRNLRKKENDISKQLLDIALRMSEDIANGEMSPRLEEAYHLLEKGNKEECLKILNPEESKADFEKNERLLKAQEIILKNELRKNADTRVKEAVLYASVAMSTAKNDEDLHHIVKELKSVLPIVKEYDVGFDIYLALCGIYLNLAESQNGLEILEEGIALLEEKGLEESKYYLALLRSKSIAYLTMGDFNQLIDCLNDLIDRYDEIRDKQEETDPSLEIEYARSLILVSSISSIMQQSDRAIEYSTYAIEVLEELDESLAIAPIIQAFSTLALAYYNAKDLEELKDTLDEAKELIERANELNIEKSVYFESYIRLLVVEGHYHIYSENFDEGMALYERFEKEAQENKDWFKETDYLSTLHFNYRDMAAILVVKGYFAASIKIYKKLVVLPASNNNREGLAVDLTNVNTCFGALGIITTAVLNGSIDMDDEEVKEDVKDFISGALKAIEVAEKNFDTNPTVLSINITKAYCQLMSIIEITGDGLDELFNYAKKAVYYAEQCTLYPQLVIQFKSMAYQMLIDKYYEYGLDIEKEEDKPLHRELIREYVFKLFNLAELEPDIYFSVSSYIVLDYILELLSTYDEPLFDEVNDEFESLIDLIDEMEEEDEEDEDEEESEEDEGN